MTTDADAVVAGVVDEGSVDVAAAAVLVSAGAEVESVLALEDALALELESLPL